MAPLSDTRVLVTGGTSGLGRAMAQALVEAGATVALTSRDQGRAEAVAAALGSAALGIVLKATGSFLVARSVVPRMISAGAGRVVTISMNEQTMVRRGFVPYGPSGAAVEALARVMAADLASTPVTANILLPGGATATGMTPLQGMTDEVRANLLDPAIMGSPIVWLASEAADGVHDERIVATDFKAWLASRS